MPVPSGPIRQGLAGAGQAELANVGVLLDPGQLREMHDQRPLRGGLRGEVEVIERQLADVLRGGVEPARTTAA